jgi:hypothetical protein
MRNRIVSSPPRATDVAVGSLFLDACSSSQASDANVRRVQAFASMLRLAASGCGEKPLRDLMMIAGESGADVADLLAAAEFAVKDDYYRTDASRLPEKIATVSGIVRRVRANDPELARA